MVRGCVENLREIFSIQTTAVLYHIKLLNNGLFHVLGGTYGEIFYWVAQ